MMQGSELSLVAIGGGHGLAATLRALNRMTDDVCAVVSVADNGGSTGRLRASAAQAAPGDLRKCLVALAEPGSALAQAMEFRFSNGELDGHALGNLLVSAMSEVTAGLPAALAEIGSLLGVKGTVLPVTVGPVDLVASTRSGLQVDGQVAVMKTHEVERVWLTPANAEVVPEALQRIASADAIILGPGSLYTSVLAAVALPAMAEAIAAASAPLVYVCNLHPQICESEQYDVADHVAALKRHGIEPDAVLYDPATMGGATGVPHAVALPLERDGSRTHDPELLESALRQVLTNSGICRW